MQTTAPSTPKPPAAKAPAAKPRYHLVGLTSDEEAAVLKMHAEWEQMMRELAAIDMVGRRR